MGIKCHTKKTETMQFLHRSSCHPKPVFDGFLKGEIVRYIRNNNNLDTFVEEKRFFMEKLTAIRGNSETEYVISSFNMAISIEDVKMDQVNSLIRTLSPQKDGVHNVYILQTYHIANRYAYYRHDNNMNI